MANAGTPASQPRAPRAGSVARGIARAPVAIAVATVGTGHGVVRGALVAVGALADRIVTPQRAPYTPPPASLAIYPSDGRNGDLRR
jgi:hypothetical protein